MIKESFSSALASRISQESRFLRDVISQSGLMASVAMHFHGGGEAPRAASGYRFNLL